MDDYIDNEFLPHVTFQAVPIKDLVTDQNYQRRLSERHVKEAAADFDLHQINPIKVSRRDGINYVVNGQHTMAIVAAVSGSDETPVWCMIYDDMDYHDEAVTFADQQKHTHSLTPYEIFKANLEAGSDKHLLLKDLVESYGLQLGPVNKPGCICAVGALEFIYDRYGYELLSRVLRLVVNAWEGEKLSLGASILKGTARVLHSFGTEVHDDLFVEKLSFLSVKEIMRSARERGGGALGYAEAILNAYNRKLRYPLPMEKLHTASRAPEHPKTMLPEAPDPEQNSFSQMN